MANARVTRTTLELEDLLYPQLEADFGPAVGDAVFDRLDQLYLRLDRNDYLDILEYLLGEDIDLDDDLMALIADIPLPAGMPLDQD